MKLLDLIKEDVQSPCDASKCETGSFTEIPSGVNADSYKTSSDYWYCEELVGSSIKKKYCKKKPASGGRGGGGGGGCDVPTECPEDNGYNSKEFQEWVWTTYLGYPKTGNKKTRLCGIDSSCNAKTCSYSSAVDGKCGKGTKLIWKELKDKFIQFKTGSVVVSDVDTKKKECESQGLVYDETTKTCVSKTVPADPDVQTIVSVIDRYRSNLNSFYDSTGWIVLDTLSPNTYPPNYVTLRMLENITDQIVELIKQKGSSSDFGVFVDMMELLKEAYNVEKYKDIFQKKVDPEGEDVFTSIDELITKINDEADKIESSLGYDPLESPTEKQIRDIIFRGQLRSVYKSGKLNLMMMVYTYTKGEPLETNNEEEYKQIETYVSTVTNTRNFENCKNILDVYRQTYDGGSYDQPLLMKVKSQIQKCWCDKQYENLGKLGAKNMFDKELRKDRKRLIMFLNGLTSSSMGDFAIRLDESVCGGIKLSR